MLHLNFKLLERIFHTRGAKSDWLLNYPASLERKGGRIIFLALTLEPLSFPLQKQKEGKNFA